MTEEEVEDMILGAPWASEEELLAWTRRLAVAAHEAGVRADRLGRDSGPARTRAVAERSHCTTARRIVGLELSSRRRGAPSHDAA